MRNRTRKFQFTLWTPRSINSTVNQYVHRCVNGLFLMFDTHLINLSAEKTRKRWIIAGEIDLRIEFINDFSSSEFETSEGELKIKAESLKSATTWKDGSTNCYKSFIAIITKSLRKSMKSFTCWPMTVSYFPFDYVCKPHFQLASLFVKWFDSTAKMFT